jgi:hypothetical protein
VDFVRVDERDTSGWRMAQLSPAIKLINASLLDDDNVCFMEVAREGVLNVTGSDQIRPVQVVGDPELHSVFALFSHCVTQIESFTFTKSTFA